MNEREKDIRNNKKKTIWHFYSSMVQLAMTLCEVRRIEYSFGKKNFLTIFCRASCYLEKHTILEIIMNDVVQSEKFKLFE